MQQQVDALPSVRDSRGRRARSLRSRLAGDVVGFGPLDRLEPGGQRVLEHLVDVGDRHDFEAFGARRGYETEETSYVRTISQVSLEPIEWGWCLTYSGDGFLYKMVRLLTGTAVQAAQGRLRLDEAAAYLDQPPGLPLGKSPHCAPPDGLYLEQVHYGPKTRET